MSKAKKIFIILAIVAVLVIGWEVYCVLSENSSGDNTDDQDPGVAANTDDFDAYLKSLGLEEKKPVFTPSAVAKDASLFPIKYGSKGDNVRYVQRLFNEYAPLYGLPTIADDGIYGDKTNQALDVAYTAFIANGLSKDYIKKNVMTPTADGHYTISQKQFTGYEYFMKVVMHK